MVQVIDVDQQKSSEGVLRKAADVLRDGGLVVYPTETVYGLGANAFSDVASARVFKAKSRSLEKPISVAVSSLLMAHSVGVIDNRTESLIKEFLPGPLTVVVCSQSSISNVLTAGSGKIGIRIPDHPVALKLIEIFDGPITATSANLTGKPAPFSVDEALAQLGESIDIALDSGTVSGEEPSTVVDLTGEEIEVLREGPVPVSDIRMII